MEDGYYNNDGKLLKLNKNEDALYLIYLAVLSPVALFLWNEK